MTLILYAASVTKSQRIGIVLPVPCAEEQLYIQEQGWGNKQALTSKNEGTHTTLSRR
jgi:hypothetical protein